MNEKQKTISAQIMPVIEAMGYEFVGCELSMAGHYATLRIYIDQPQGVTLEDCTRVSRQVSAVLDVEDPFIDKYTLEVSSPGIERPLFTEAHFKRFQGHQALVRLSAPIEGRRNFTGTIEAIEDGQLFLKVEERLWPLPLSLIFKANLMA